MTARPTRDRRPRLERLRREDGITITELLGVLVILGIVMAGMVTLFVSATTAQTEQHDRFEAQQEARLALEGLRRELRCANAVTLPMTSTTSPFPTTATTPSSSLTLRLGTYCPTYTTSQFVTWCTQTLSAQRHVLWRYNSAAPASCGASGGLMKADYLTASNVFTAYAAPAGGILGKLSIVFAVDIKPSASTSRYTVSDQIVLRNTGRS